jgi:branched-chain amino acid transport system ATP-binding protein
MSLLRVLGLTKYFGGLAAVKNLDFEVPSGQVFGIIGPNGAGKTTIFNLITGFYPPTRGQIFFKDEELTRLKSYHMAPKGIARTFQGISLFNDMTVLDNVLVGYQCHLRAGVLGSMLRVPSMTKEEGESRDKAHEWLEIVGLASKKDFMASGLSYGEQIKVGIARALAISPSLLLLDEPAGGLTFGESKELMKLVETILNRGITVMLIEHRMHFMMSLAERILVINYGEKICEGSPGHVKKDERVIQAYLGKE